MAAPNGPSQEAVIRSAMRSVSAESVAYVETHGTGTALGDPMEVGALRRVLAGASRDEMLVLLGALKSHIGHTEGAAGVMGVLKAAMGLQRMQVPPNLHLSELNPKLELEGFSASMPMQMQELAMQSAHACAAGVSSFGMSGTNAHAVLEATEHRLTSHEALNGFRNKVLTAINSLLLMMMAPL